LLSQTKKRKDGGEFLYFDKKGIEKSSGQYDSYGKKTGKWWFYRREIVFYENGKKTAKKALVVKEVATFKDIKCGLVNRLQSG
jgi:hypothetical protein